MPMISFRVSQDTYDEVRKASEEMGLSRYMLALIRGEARPISGEVSVQAGPDTDLAAAVGKLRQRESQLLDEIAVLKGELAKRPLGAAVAPNSTTASAGRLPGRFDTKAVDRLLSKESPSKPKPEPSPFGD